SCLQPMTTKKPSGETFRYIDIDAIDNDNQVVTAPKELLTKDAPSRASREVREGDTLFSMVRPYLRNIAYVDFGLADCIASTGFFVCRPVDGISSRYMYALMSSSYVVDGLNAFMKGDNSPSIRQENILAFAFPVPPLPEQNRIVARIESLFEKLDRAKELVQSALDSFETRKAAILHKAFTGELTAKWREEHGFGIESWEERPLGKCGTLERGRSKHRPRNAPELFGGCYPFIQTGDVAVSDMYITEHKQTLSEVGLNQSKLFPKGTLCITIAANIGDVAILSYDSCFPDSVVGFLPNESTDVKFIYFAMSVLQSRLDAEAPATAQKNINLKVLNEIMLCIPPLSEQQEIVRILDGLLEKEKTVQELSSRIEKIDHMKKAILARAFRGELGTTDASEESALGLLGVG
ncbi:MAG: restriction endonuclease subunit S, partial [Oscillospiraceae bacterium]|nr:restriction endonuclease subunit S [Oscillospiraceae bacterium]